MANKHTIGDLHQMQSLPLSAKIQMTKRRIQEWVDYYGEDGVYISFSGGKDSTVLLHIAREIYPNIKAVFVDTGLEYPEIRQFVKTFGNVEFLKPKMNFRQVIEKYGYPFISKEVSGCVYSVKKFLDQQRVANANHFVELDHIPTRMAKLLGILSKENKIMSESISGDIKIQKGAKIYVKLQGMLQEDGVMNVNGADKSLFNYERYKFFLEDGAPDIASQCCDVMKKAPAHAYSRQTGRKAITGQTASESRLRTQKWLQNGCNGFDMKNPISNPLSFWTEQDILMYIYENHIEIASVYGEVDVDYSAMGEIEGQMNFSDYGIFDLERPLLKTTGCQRTGCMHCNYGLQMEKTPNRYECMAQTHPKTYDYCMRGGHFNENGKWKPDNRGLGYWYCIEWINKHGNFNIIYPNREYYLETYMTEETKKYLWCHIK